MVSNNEPTPGVSAPPAKAPMSLVQLIDTYIKLRDRKRLMESQHKEAIKPFIKTMEEIEGHLLVLMEQEGVNSLNTDGGTAYQSLKKRATIRDGEAFNEFVIENKAWHLVDWKANANAVFDHIEANNGTPPPGVNPSSYVAVNVRRPGEKD